MIEQAYFYLYAAVLLGLGVAAVVALIRSVTAGNIIGKFIGINMLTTITVIIICVLALLFGESYLPDIAVIYALLSCIAVVLLSKIYISLFKKGGKGGRKE